MKSITGSKIIQNEIIDRIGIPIFFRHDLKIYISPPWVQIHWNGGMCRFVLRAWTLKVTFLESRMVCEFENSFNPFRQEWNEKALGFPDYPIEKFHQLRKYYNCKKKTILLQKCHVWTCDHNNGSLRHFDSDSKQSSSK